MRICDVKLTRVSVPLEAPLRHSYAVHGFFTRTVLQVFTDEGIVGLSETTAPPQLIEPFVNVLLGEDPLNHEKIRMRISQRGYYSRQWPIASAFEIACLDISGKAFGVPVYKLLGGKIRERVPIAAYLFYRHANAEGAGEVTTPAEMAAHCRDLVAEHGFRTIKLKGGVFEPEHDLATIAALREAMGEEYLLRLDPNAVWTAETAVRIGARLEPFHLEYYEDPTWGIAGMAAVRERVRIPLATNMCVIDFDHFAPAVDRRAVDIVLSDPWYWGGLQNTKILAGMCKTFGLGIGLHSGVELGIGLSAMLHVAATIPNLLHAIDSHYHHLLDDVIAGGKMRYAEGAMSPPEGPGLGVSLDEDKLAQYEELFLREQARNKGGYTADPARPDWYARYPGW
ncbi:MAG: enolase C-terminal domain-like protein [Bacteroidota bacterium]